MADKIRLLPEIVANQIAAGEVADSPEHVVKEMMENSLDAGAHTIKVNYRNGGIDLIQIVDDGCGMSAVDARMAFDRHATSKISTVEDLYSIGTFGFRGEALASIAAVSEVVLRTRQSDDETGTETSVSGGRFVAQTPVMCPAGAQFFVRNLFYNIPARRKFLKEPARLASAIKSGFCSTALCNPDVRFELYANDAPVYVFPSANLLDRIADVAGNSAIKRNLLEVDVETSIVKIHGYVGRPEAAKKRKGEQYMFVNGRYFRSAALHKAVMKSYENLIPESCTPAYFLYFTIDPERVDVNVHPQKTEVKFADADAVWQMLAAAVRETLVKTGSVPMMDFDNEQTIEIPVMQRGTFYSEPRSTSNAFYNPFEIADEQDDTLSDNIAGFSAASKPAIGAPHPCSDFGESTFEIVSPLQDEVVSQGFDTEEYSAEAAAPVHFEDIRLAGDGFAVATLRGRLTAVDLRRAKERVVFDRCMAAAATGGANAGQKLLFPEKLILSADEYDLLERYEVEFAVLGFEFDFQGDCTVSVTAAPADIASDDIDETLYDLLQAIDSPADSERERLERRADALARGVSRSSVRGMNLSAAETLLQSLAESGNISYTHSGKRITAEISSGELRRILS